MVGIMVDLVNKWKRPLKRTPANLKENLGALLPNAIKILESGDVGLKFL
jgi:hypothetical protein